MEALASIAPAEVATRMSSREVADLTGKNHAHVMRDIREIVAQLTQSKVGFCCEPTSYVGANGQLYDMYSMDKETTICLLTSYDAAARMKVIQRWQLLENQGATPALPQTYKEALVALVQQVEQREHTEKLLAAAQPAVDFYEAVTDSRSAIPMGEASKVLGVADMGQNKLFAFLRSKGLLMSTAKHRNMPYQKYIDAGYFRVVEQRYNTPDGETRISLRCLVLQKGLDYIRKLLLASS